MSLAKHLQPIDWDTIDDAIFDWVSSKVPANVEVQWEDQNLPQAPYPYVTLKRNSETEEGGIRETRISTDLNQQAGEENELSTTGPVRFTLMAQAHADPEVRDATKILSKIKASLGQLSVLQELSAAGLSVVDEMAVTDASLVVNGEWLSRAVFDVIFRTASVMTERTGYIDKVQLKSDDLGVDTVVDAS